MSVYSENAKRAAKSGAQAVVICDGKHPFESQSLANAVAQRSNRRKGQHQRMSAYRCCACFKWHVGSDKRGLRAKGSRQFKKRKEMESYDDFE